MPAPCHCMGKIGVGCRSKSNLSWVCRGQIIPPMDITLRSNAYEGVTADITGMLSHLLHIEIVVKGFPSRAAAIEALKRGEIDLLSTSNSYEEEQQLLLTDKYMADDPAIYKKY